MNTVHQPSHWPASPERRLFITWWVAALVSALTSCDDGSARAQQVPQQPTPPPGGETVPQVPEVPAQKVENANPYPLPNNHFEVLPAVKPLDPQFLARVQKITLAERKAQLMATQWGGKASDEVKKLQQFWLKPFDTLEEIQRAYKAWKLIALPSIDEGRYFAIQLAGDLDMKNRFWYNLIHPDAYKRFNEFVAKVFYSKTGKMLKVGGLVRSETYQKRLRWHNVQATKDISPHTFGRTIDFSVPEVFNPITKKMEPTSPQEHEFISQLLTYYEKSSPDRTSWLVEGGNAYHGTHYPIPKK